MKTLAAPIRIWYQSFIHPEQQAPYFRILQERLAALADPGVQFDLQGLSPPDLALHRITEFRCAVQVVKNAVAAERQGYDAVAIGHFQDGGLYEARAALDIPVLGLGEASMLHACTLGQKVAIVTIHPAFIPFIEEQIGRYGLGARITAVKAVTTDPDELVRAFTDGAAGARVARQFREQAQPLVEAGAEVIVPGGGLPALLLARLKDFSVGPAAVLDPIAVLVKAAEMAVKLYRQIGTGPSRAGTFAKPSERALREFLES